MLTLESGGSPLREKTRNSRRFTVTPRRLYERE